MIELKLIADKLNLKNNYRIVFWGDSLTSTEWVHPNWREIIEYVLKEELQQLMGDWKVPSWGIRCFNLGFDGATTDDFINKIGEVTELNPDLVIYLGGGNDVTFNFSAEKHIENTQKMIDLIKTFGSELIFCSNLPSLILERDRFYPTDYYPEILKLFPNQGINFIDMYKQYQKFELSKLFTFISNGNPEAEIKKGEIDSYHPNSLGNAYIAKVILEQGFSINFDPEKYMLDIRSDVMYPEYK